MYIKRRQHPTIEPMTVYDYLTAAGVECDDDAMYNNITIATSIDQIDAVNTHIQQSLHRVMYALDMGSDVPGTTMQPREYLNDISMWLISESFAFETHFDEFANSMRLLSRYLREISEYDSATDLYDAISEMYGDFAE